MSVSWGESIKGSLVIGAWKSNGTDFSLFIYLFILQVTLLFYVPGEKGCLTHPHTSGHLAPGEHTVTTVRLCIDFTAVLSRKRNLAFMSYPKSQVMMNLTL